MGGIACGGQSLMSVLIAHFEAPLMSFGGPQVDQIGPTGLFPTVSQVTGLLGNALGYVHGEFAHLQRLQERISIASVLVREGGELQDYQTVDLGQDHLRLPSWTTRGRTEHRDGGLEARFGTHIRLRRYRADASVLTAVSVSPADESPTVGELLEALRKPARPLFVGRKCCLPAAPIGVGLVGGTIDLTEALSQIPIAFPERWTSISKDTLPLELSAEIPVPDERELQPEARLGVLRVTDERDWKNQLHGGQRIVARRKLLLSASRSPHVGGGS